MSKKQDLITFGHALLSTQDLDPLYVGLRGLDLPKRQLHKFLVAYWCFYHVGAASWMSQQADGHFWNMMLIAGENDRSPVLWGLPANRWPRAAERRHFRGAACVRALRKMTEMYPEPERLVQALIDETRHAGVRHQRTVMLLAQELPLFGPWISFKVADMLERVCGVDVVFDRDIGLIYKEPRAGLELWAETCGAGLALTLEDHYEELLSEYALVTAPPVPEVGGRGCGPQEVETILCKWKSYMGGHYYVGKDICEHREALHGWGATAARLAAAYPPLPSSEA